MPASKARTMTDTGLEGEAGLGSLLARVRRISQHIQQITEPTRRLTERFERLSRSRDRLYQEPEEPDIWWNALALYLRTPKISAEVRARAVERLADEVRVLVHEAREERYKAALSREAWANARTLGEERRHRVAAVLPIAVHGLRDHIDGRKGVSGHHPGIGDLGLTDPPEKVLQVLEKTVARLVMEDLFLPAEISRAERPGGPLVVAREHPEAALEPGAPEWARHQAQGRPDENEFLIELLKQTDGRERLARALIAISRGADTPAKLSAALGIEPGNARQIFNRLRKLDRPM